MANDHFETIKVALTKAQPFMSYLPITITTPEARVQDLRQALENLKRALEVFGGRRKGKRTRDNDSHKSDWLDSGGVALWNRARAASRKLEEMEGAKKDVEIAALVRLTAFRMVEAATDSRPNVDDIEKNLHMICRTIYAILESEDRTALESLLALGADYVEELQKVVSSAKEEFNTASQLSGALDFYLIRVDVAVADDKVDFASTSAEKAMDLAHHNDVSLSDLRRLAYKFWSIGDALCRKILDQPDMYEAAVKWAQISLQAVRIIEEAHSQDAVWAELNIAAMQTMIKAHLKKGDQQALNEASAVLDSLLEITGEADLDTRHAVAFYNLGICKADKDGVDSYKKAFNQVIKTLSWNLDTTHSVLSEMMRLNEEPELQTWAVQYLLNIALRNEQGHEFVGTILLDTLYSLKSRADQRPAETIAHIRGLLDAIASTRSFKMDPTELNACENVTILWALAEHMQTQNRRHDQAAEIYKIGAHEALASDNASKWLRKAAMCYIAAADADRASEALHQCPSDEAATQYLYFLLGVNQGRENIALQATQNIANCADFQGKHIISMSSLAQDFETAHILTACLKLLLDCCENNRFRFNANVEKICIIKSLVYLTVGSIEKSEDKSSLCEELLGYVEQVNNLVEQDHASFKDSVDAAVWIAKYAYSAAIGGIKTWEAVMMPVVFNAVSILMEACMEASEGQLDSDWATCICMAMYLCFCGNLFEYRSMKSGNEKSAMLNNLQQYLPTCLRRIQSALSTAQSSQDVSNRLQGLLDTLWIFEVELCAEAADWQGLQDVLSSMSSGNDQTYKIETLETISDLLIRFPECPAELSQHVLDAVLSSQSCDAQDDIASFSLWIRAAVVDISKTTEAVAEKTLSSYFVKALEVMKDGSGNVYPKDEAEWLMSQAWNRGIESNNAGDLQATRQWWDLAMQISIYQPNRNYQQQINDHFRQLLARMASDA